MIRKDLVALFCGLLMSISFQSCGDADLFSQKPEIRMEEKGDWVLPLGYADVGIGEVLLGHKLGNGALKIDREQDRLLIKLEDPNAFRWDLASFTARQVKNVEFTFKTPSAGYSQDMVIPGNDLNKIGQIFPLEVGRFTFSLSDKIKSSEKIVLQGDVRVKLSNVPMKATFQLALVNATDERGEPIRLFLDSNGTEKDLEKIFSFSGINLLPGNGNTINMGYEFSIIPENSPGDVVLKKGEAIEIKIEILKANIKEFKGVVDPTEIAFQTNTSKWKFDEWSRAQALWLKGTKFDLTLKNKGVDMGMSVGAKLKSLKKSSSIPLYIPPIKVFDIKSLRQEDVHTIRYDGDALEAFLSALDKSGMEIDCKVIVPTRGKIAFNSQLSLAGGYRLEQPLDLRVEKFPVKATLPLSSLEELKRFDGLYETISLCIVGRSNIPFEIVCEKFIFLDAKGKEIPGATVTVSGGIIGSTDGKSFADSRIVAELTAEQSRLIRNATKVKVQGYIRTLSEETVQLRPSQSMALHISAGINHKF